MDDRFSVREQLEDFLISRNAVVHIFHSEDQSVFIGQQFGCPLAAQVHFDKIHRISVLECDKSPFALVVGITLVIGITDVLQRGVFVDRQIGKAEPVAIERDLASARFKFIHAGRLIADHKHDAALRSRENIISKRIVIGLQNLLKADNGVSVIILNVLCCFKIERSSSRSRRISASDRQAVGAVRHQNFQSRFRIAMQAQADGDAALYARLRIKGVFFHQFGILQACRVIAENESRRRFFRIFGNIRQEEDITPEGFSIRIARAQHIDGFVSDAFRIGIDCAAVTSPVAEAVALKRDDAFVRLSSMLAARGVDEQKRIFCSGVGFHLEGSETGGLFASSVYIRQGRSDNAAFQIVDAIDHVAHIGSLQIQIKAASEAVQSHHGQRSKRILTQITIRPCQSVADAEGFRSVLRAEPECERGLSVFRSKYVIAAALRISAGHALAVFDINRAFLSVEFQRHAVDERTGNPVVFLISILKRLIEISERLSVFGNLAAEHFSAFGFKGKDALLRIVGSFLFFEPDALEHGGVFFRGKNINFIRTLIRIRDAVIPAGIQTHAAPLDGDLFSRLIRHGSACRSSPSCETVSFHGKAALFD